MKFLWRNRRYGAVAGTQAVLTAFGRSLLLLAAAPCVGLPELVLVLVLVLLLLGCEQVTGDDDDDGGSATMSVVRLSSKMNDRMR